MTEINEKAAQLDQAIAARAVDTRAWAHAIATTYTLAAESVITALIAAIHETNGRDGRKIEWQTRVFIYESPFTTNSEPVADSDPDVPIADSEMRMLAGRTIHSGMPAMVEWLADIMQTFHDQVFPGLLGTLKKKTQTLRTQMTQRGDGTGCLTLNYDAKDSRTGVVKPYRVKCFVWRAADAPAPRKLPWSQSLLSNQPQH